MAILQEVDKCIRCNGCYIACKRTWKMKPGDSGTHGKHRVDYYQRVVIKSLRKQDMGPFLRYSCWHCDNPPCAGACPIPGALFQRSNGAVDIDFTKCTPDVAPCTRQCVKACQRGGYPKIGKGDVTDQKKMFKCTLCSERAGHVKADGTLGGDLPSKARKDSTGYISTIWDTLAAHGDSTTGYTKYVPELEHQPTCVMTCPAKAMHYDTKANVKKYCDAIDAAGGYYNGDGSMFWVTKKYSVLAAPKADPFVEDHIAPMISGLVRNPLVATAVVPTLIVGGLMAISARRSENEKVGMVVEGEV